MAEPRRRSSRSSAVRANGGGTAPLSSSPGDEIRGRSRPRAAASTTATTRTTPSSLSKRRSVSAVAAPSRRRSGDGNADEVRSSFFCSVRHQRRGLLLFFSSRSIHAAGLIDCFSERADGFFGKRERLDWEDSTTTTTTTTSTSSKTQKKNSQPLLLPLRDELPAMALLTLLYAIQGIPLGLTMGSV